MLSPQEELLGKALVEKIRNDQLREVLWSIRGNWAASNNTYRDLTAAKLTDKQLTVVWDLFVGAVDGMYYKFFVLLDELVRREQARISIAAPEQPEEFVPWEEFVTIEAYGVAADLHEKYAVDAATIWDQRHKIVPLSNERNGKR